MKKNLIACSVAAILSVSMLSGCGESSGPNSVSSDNIASQNQVMQNAKFKEGVHYEVIENALDRPAEHVMEVFSFACPHCYTAEKELVSNWKAELKDAKSYDFELVHSGYDKWFKDAQVFYTLKLMNREDVYPIYFEARQNGKIVNDDTLFALLAEHKVREKPYKLISESNRVDDAIKAASGIEKEAGLNGVPAFVVSGKYKIKLEGIKAYTDIKEITEFLIENQP